MGEVYQALDTRLNRRIAIKVLPSDVAVDGDRLRPAPEVPGLLLPESGRLRYAFLLRQRGDARAD